jgi:uncharacterized protein
MDPVTMMVEPIRLDFEISAGTAQSRFLLGLAEGELRGQRCPVCGKVYMPPRGSCPTDGVPTEEEVLLPDHGIVTTFCVVNLQFHPAAPPAPYVCAQVLLEGADTPLFGLVAGVPADEVRMGMKVKAEWKPREEWTTNLMNIKWFQPTGEPDAAYETYQEHV